MSEYSGPEFARIYAKTLEELRQMDKKAWSEDNDYDATVVVEVEHHEGEPE